MGVKADLNNLFDGRHLLPFDPDIADRRPILDDTVELSLNVVQPADEQNSVLQMIVVNPATKTENFGVKGILADGTVLDDKEDLKGGNCYWETAQGYAVSWEGPHGFNRCPDIFALPEFISNNSFNQPNDRHIEGYTRRDAVIMDDYPVANYTRIHTFARYTKSVFIKGIVLPDIPAGVVLGACIKDGLVIVIASNQEMSVVNDDGVRLYYAVFDALTNTIASWVDGGIATFPAVTDGVYMGHTGCFMFNSSGTKAIGEHHWLRTSNQPAQEDSPSGHISRNTLNANLYYKIIRLDITVVAGVASMTHAIETIQHLDYWSQENANTSGSKLEAVGFFGDTEKVILDAWSGTNSTTSTFVNNTTDFTKTEDRAITSTRCTFAYNYAHDSNFITITNTEVTESTTSSSNIKTMVFSDISKNKEVFVRYVSSLVQNIVPPFVVTTTKNYDITIETSDGDVLFTTAITHTLDSRFILPLNPRYDYRNIIKGNLSGDVDFDHENKPAVSHAGMQGICDKQGNLFLSFVLIGAKSIGSDFARLPFNSENIVTNIPYGESTLLGKSLAGWTGDLFNYEKSKIFRI